MLRWATCMATIGLLATVMGACASDPDGGATRKKASGTGGSGGGEIAGPGGGGPTGCDAMCTHVYVDCQSAFEDQYGAPLDQSACVETCSGGALTSDQIACFTTSDCSALAACSTPQCQGDCSCDNLADGVCADASCVDDPDCAGCTPSCDGKSCGPDGCGGECGQCPSSQACNAAGQCEATSSCSLGLGAICTVNSSAPNECCASGYQCWLYQTGDALCCSGAQSPCPQGDPDCCPGLACGSDGVCH